VPYSTIDHDIRDWVEAHSLTLFDTWAGEDRRFCYVSSPRGECLQISVEPPRNDEVLVVVSDIETIDDEEVRLSWTFPVSEVRAGLDIVLSAVRDWFERRG
jgi:hypothetical protein